MAKLTKRVVESLRAEGRELTIWDDALPGFGVRVFVSGKRTYTVQYRHNRRTRRLALGLHGVLTCEQARAMARDLLARARRGDDPAGMRARAAQAPTVREIAGRYLSEHAFPKKRASSAEKDAANLRLHLLPILGQMRVCDVTRADVARLHHAMKSKPGAANRVLSLASKMFGMAEAWGLRPDGSNPCRRIERYPERKMERFLSPLEMARLGDTLSELEESKAEPLEVVAAIRLLILTGARRGEILRLRWSEVDFDAACLRLSESKEGGPKRIALGLHAVGVLEGLPHRSPWVLPTARGDRPISLSKPWERVRRRAGLADVRLHDLRHSFASAAATGGDSLFVVGALLGHRRASTTERYAHLAADPRRAAAERIDGRIGAMLNATPARRPAWDAVDGEDDVDPVVVPLRGLP